MLSMSAFILASIVLDDCKPIHPECLNTMEESVRRSLVEAVIGELISEMVVDLDCVIDDEDENMAFRSADARWHCYKTQHAIRSAICAWEQMDGAPVHLTMVEYEQIVCVLLKALYLSGVLTFSLENPVDIDEAAAIPRDTAAGPTSSVIPRNVLGIAAA